MKLYLFILLSVLTAQCGKNRHPVLYQRDPKWEIADQVYDHEIAASVFCQLLKKDKNLHVCESGWGLMGKKNIQVMHCGFFYHKELDVRQARELLLTIGDLYLKTINENERIRLFLEEYPFLPKNVEIRVFLQNKRDVKT